MTILLVGKDEVGDSDGVKTRILLTSSTFKKSTEAGYLTSITKKALNYLQHTFT